MGICLRWLVLEGGFWVCLDIVLVACATIFCDRFRVYLYL